MPSLPENNELPEHQKEASDNPEALDESWLPLKEMTGPTAHALAETHLLLHDIQHSGAGMALWFQKYAGLDNKSEEDTIIGNALLRDSIVQFVACFEGPFGISVQDVFGCHDGGVEYFQWLKDIRDSYVAHKFGALRQCAVGVLVDPSGPHVVGYGRLLQIYHGPPKEAENDLLRFMQIAAEHLAARADSLIRELLDEAHSMSNPSYSPGAVLMGRRM